MSWPEIDTKTGREQVMPSTIVARPIVGSTPPDCATAMPTLNGGGAGSNVQDEWPPDE